MPDRETDLLEVLDTIDPESAAEGEGLATLRQYIADALRHQAGA